MPEPTPAPRRRATYLDDLVIRDGAPHLRRAVLICDIDTDEPVTVLVAYQRAHTPGTTRRATSSGREGSFSSARASSM